MREKGLEYGYSEEEALKQALAEAAVSAPDTGPPLRSAVDHQRKS